MRPLFKEEEKRKHLEMEEDERMKQNLWIQVLKIMYFQT